MPSKRQFNRTDLFLRYSACHTGEIPTMCADVGVSSARNNIHRLGAFQFTAMLQGAAVRAASARWLSSGLESAARVSRQRRSIQLIY